MSGPLEERLEAQKKAQDGEEGRARSPLARPDNVLVEQELPSGYREAWTDFLSRLPRREWREGWVGIAPDGSTLFRSFRKERRGFSRLRRDSPGLHRLRYVTAAQSFGDFDGLRLLYTEDGRFGSDMKLG